MINFVSRGKTPWFPVETLGTWGVKVCSLPSPFIEVSGYFELYTGC